MDQLPKKENLWNSSRNADMKYIPGKTYTVTLDGFIISDNVKCDMYKNINTGYSYSDHDPVYVKFELNKESVLNKFKLKIRDFCRLVIVQKYRGSPEGGNI